MFPSHLITYDVATANVLFVPGICTLILPLGMTLSTIPQKSRILDLMSANIVELSVRSEVGKLCSLQIKWPSNECVMFFDTDAGKCRYMMGRSTRYIDATYALADIRDYDILTKVASEKFDDGAIKKYLLREGD